MSNKDISRPPKKAPGDPSKRSLGFPRRCLQTLRGHLGSPNSTSRPPKGPSGPPKGPSRGPKRPLQFPKHPSLHTFGLHTAQSRPKSCRNPKTTAYGNTTFLGTKAPASSTLFYFKSRLITARCTNSKGPSTRFSQFPPPLHLHTTLGWQTPHRVRAQPVLPPGPRYDLSARHTGPCRDPHLTPQTLPGLEPTTPQPHTAPPSPQRHRGTAGRSNRRPPREPPRGGALRL